MSLKVGLAGQGEALARRAALLAEAGVEARLLSADASDAVLEPLQLLFVAGLAEGEARAAGRPRPGAWACWSMSRTCCRCAISMFRPWSAGANCC